MDNDNNGNNTANNDTWMKRVTENIQYTPTDFAQVVDTLLSVNTEVNPDTTAIKGLISATMKRWATANEPACHEVLRKLFGVGRARQ